MIRRRLFQFVAFAALMMTAALAAAYLYDPPWVEHMTMGIRNWQQDPSGVPFRWTTGRASFFIPSGATTITIPLRAALPGPNGTAVVVRVSVDDRWMADVDLPDPAVWVRPTLPLATRPTRRHFRRVDLHVSRTVGESALGVQMGQVALR